MIWNIYTFAHFCNDSAVLKNDRADPVEGPDLIRRLIADNNLEKFKASGD
jgi:hypothetical protein